MRNALSNYGAAARRYDNYLTTDLPGEREHAKETAIEERATRIFNEMYADAEMITGILTEACPDNERMIEFCQALADAQELRHGNNDVRNLVRILGRLDDVVMDYAAKSAESWDESL